MPDVTILPASGEWTVADVDALPDDGLRYELVDGVLLVSPAPLLRHQVALTELLVLLHGSAPAGVRVVAAPVDVRLTATRQLQPDIVVLRRAEPVAAKVTEVPLLVVEVLSPSTRATDRSLKRLVYEQAGVPSYWLVDPEAPSLTALELRAGVYDEVAIVTGPEAWTAQQPFPVTVIPSDLVR